MKAAQIKKYGGKEVVEININAPKPSVSKDHLVVEVYAAGVNPIDWKVREGYMKQWMSADFPKTLGTDFSGVVAEVGEGVSGFKKGDKVYGNAGILGGGSGSFAEFVSAKKETVAQMPKKIEYIDAASLPLAGVSALQALTEHINLARGQKILIHDGAGGIGIFVIQLAKHLGAYVATTVGRFDRFFAQKLGADLVIDYKKEIFENLISDCDAVFDTAGGETYTRSFRVVKRGGIIVSMVEQPNLELAKQYGVKTVSQGTRVTTDRLTRLAELVEQGVIKTHVDKIFSLKATAEALEYLRNGLPKGKIVIEVKKG